MFRRNHGPGRVPYLDRNLSGPVCQVVESSPIFE